jgi:hypothetical protein
MVPHADRRWPAVLLQPLLLTAAAVLQELH